MLQFVKVAEQSSEATAERAGELLALLEGSAVWVQQRQEWAQSSSQTCNNIPVQNNWKGGRGGLCAGDWLRGDFRGGVAAPSWLLSDATSSREQENLRREAEAAALESAAAKAAVLACSASGRNLHRFGDEQTTLLMRACKAGHLPLVRALFDHAAQEHRGANESEAMNMNTNGESTAFMAPTSKIFENTLGVDGPCESKNGWAALHFAAQVNRVLNPGAQNRIEVRKRSCVLMPLIA